MYTLEDRPNGQSDAVKTAETGKVKVSVIVPAYNTEKYIERCLNSLVNQTLKEIEIIVIDDGSTDRTTDIIKEYASKDSRIILLNQSHQKQGAARNKGLKAAHGEYIGFVDSDDWIDSDYYEKLYNTAKEYNSDIALADYIRTGNGKTKKRLNIRRQELQKDIKGKMKLCKQLKHPCPTNKIYRADMLKREDIYFPEGVYCEDKIFTCKAVYYANTVVSVPETYYYYFRNPNSTVHTKDKKHDLDKKNAKKETEAFLIEKGVIKKFRLADPLTLIKLLRLKRVKSNYAKKLKQLRNDFGKRQIRVIFYVTENQKWSYQSLYDALDKDENFYPLVLVSILKDVHNGKDKIRLNLEENYNFFKSRNMNVEYLYKDKKYTDLKAFRPDIVFYEQPWGVPGKYKPHNVSKYALCCYVPYSIAINPLGIKGKLSFFNSLWKHYIASKELLPDCMNLIKINQKSIVVTGHPKLDIYNKNISYENKHYVIYAPHHSVGNSMLKFATFEWSGLFMLEYAKRHPEINWVFKPHPNLMSYFIKTGFMTKDEIESYFKQWSEIGLVHTQGDYYSLFMESDAIICDCSSFLTEYFLTGKPFIHLVSHRGVRQNCLNEIVSDNYYKVYNADVLEKYLQEIIINKNDFLKDTRAKKIDEIFHERNNSAQNILQDIKTELEIL